MNYSILKKKSMAQPIQTLLTIGTFWINLASG